MNSKQLQELKYSSLKLVVPPVGPLSELFHNLGPFECSLFKSERFEIKRICSISDPFKFYSIRNHFFSDCKDRKIFQTVTANHLGGFDPVRNRGMVNRNRS